LNDLIFTVITRARNFTFQFLSFKMIYSLFVSKRYIGFFESDIEESNELAFIGVRRFLVSF
jgi:hypothetical protein